MKIIINKSFANGCIKETEKRKNYREISTGEKMEIAMQWILTKGIKCQLSQH